MAWAFAARTFQSTLPVRGATDEEGGYGLRYEISIHAPRTGSDGHHRRSRSGYYRFQSTLPVRGATHMN